MTDTREPAVTLITRFAARGTPEADRFLDRLAAVKDSVAAEVGHVSYRIFRAIDDETVCYAVEEWLTRADAERHIAASGEGPEAQAALALLTTPPTTAAVTELQTGTE